MLEHFRAGYYQIPFPSELEEQKYRDAYEIGKTFREETDSNVPINIYVDGLMDELFRSEEDLSPIKEFVYTKLGLNGMADTIHQTAVSKGFWDNTSIPEKLALIHSEVSEVLEADRKDHGKGAVEEELADILIRTLDLCAHLGMDVDHVMKKKMLKNRSRPHKHGNLY